MNNSLKCIIVDDDKMSREILEHLCTKIDGVAVVCKCESAIEAISELEKQDFDLLFLDIEMPDLTGIDLAQSVSNLPQIMFTTSLTEHAIEAFELDVTDYLTKPITLPRLIKAINKAKTKITKELKEDFQSELFIKTEGKLVKIKYADILYIETLDDYLVIHTNPTSKHIIHSTLSAMNEKLKGREFLKVHRSFILNLKKIDSIVDTHVMIQNKVIPVSRSHRKLLMDHINLL